MLIVCPNCATSYQIEAASLGQGRSVRCARCRNVWFATAPQVVPAVAMGDLEVIENEPPATVEAAQIPDPGPPATAEPDPDVTEAEIVGPAGAAEPASEPGSVEGIDLAGLGTEMDGERAQQEAEADAVLAEVIPGEATVEESPPLVPQQEPQPAHGGDDIETFAARRLKREANRRRRWVASSLSTTILLLAAANAAVIAWRADIVRLLPQTASLYAAIGLPVNLRGLAFENIRMSRTENDGVSVLVVEGTIANVSGHAVEVPRLRLAVRNGAKNEVYAWTARPSRSVLGPNESLPFRSRLASPPADAHEVMVRFFSRRDLVAGLN